MSSETADHIRMGPALRAHLERAGGAVTISLVGEFDILAVPEMESLLEQVEQAHPRRIVVDLAYLTFIDSTALQTLIAAKLRAKEHGRAFTVRDGDGVAARLIALAGVEDFLLTETDPGAGSS
jgi:anti-anti-sigma factor